MAGDTLDVYWGEFMVQPAPMECSFNFCSFKCAYCFANLNKPERVADTKTTLRLLQNFHTRDTLKAKLLKANYPVIVSNRVDPFAQSNYQQAVPILETMAGLGVPVVVQTKGGEHAYKVLDFLPPSVWYLSISFTDDSLRKKIEPGAPSIDSRFELIKTLTGKGHRVVIGYNPCVPEWCDDPETLLGRAKEAGAEGVWIERLHLNIKQEANLTEKEKAAMGLDVIARAKKRSHAREDFQAFMLARQVAEDLGLEVFSKNQPNRSDFFRPWHEIYPNTFPTMQDFVNFCHEQGWENCVVDFDTFAEVMCASLPEGTLDIGHYLGATAHNAWQTHQLSNWMTYKQLLALAWQDPRISFCPARLTCFAYAGERDNNDEWVSLTDENDMPLMMFDSSGGFTDWYADIALATEPEKQ